MRVGIYANISEPSSWGGAAHVLLGLLEALGKNAPSDIEIVVLGPSTGSEWLAPALKGKMQLVYPPATAGGEGWHKLEKQRKRIEKFLAKRPRLRRYFAAPTNGYFRKDLHRQDLCPSVSTGFIESLNLDVIHFPYQSFIVTSCPSIFTPHDLQHVHLPSLWSPDVILYREVFYRFACNCATRVAAAFPWVGDDLAENFGVPRGKIAVIPWGVSTTLRSSPSAEDLERVRSRYDLPARFAFYPASPWPHKNHTRLIQALKVLRDRDCDIGLVLSGGENVFNRSAWSDLRRKISEMGLDDRIRLPGYIDSDDMRAVYQLASIVVAPTLFEAGSGPVAEAWVEGVPAACSDIPMLRGHAEDAALFFDPFRPPDIADKMQALLKDAKLRSDLVAAGKKRLESYSWDKCAQGYFSLYRELAARNPRL